MQTFKRYFVKFSVLTLLGALFVFTSCATKPLPEAQTLHKSDQLHIQKLTKNVYIHTSYLSTESFGNVACNGVVFLDNNEAVIYDTPVDDASSAELLNWLANHGITKVNAVIASHFHEDALGGLQEFHSRGIASYAHPRTPELAREDGVTHLPQNTIDGSRVFNFGNRTIVAVYLGEGHTADNIIAYFTDQRVLAGGCLVKELNAGKGYTEDANLPQWPTTIRRVQQHYGRGRIVIPGHGAYGGKELLQYTRELFEEKP
ncbi:MAG: subclass B1 metallo-beta-lactamase [Weeksellaceae bacterium]|nr:subclass B1 metallo-beta-lactamase [Weeksellaceae bacterium]